MITLINIFIVRLPLRALWIWLCKYTEIWNILTIEVRSKFARGHYFVYLFRFSQGKLHASDTTAAECPVPRHVQVAPDARRVVRVSSRRVATIVLHL